MLKLRAKHFLTGAELSRDELAELLHLAELCREQRATGMGREILSGKTVTLLFEKPSLRTRVSFSVAIRELGGFPLEISSQVRKKEDPEDTIRVLSGYCHGVMARTHAHSILERMAEKATVPVINGLSDAHHPCQVLADLQTLVQSFGQFKGLKLAYVGDGNNMLNSLLLLAPYLGVEVHFACPVGYEPNSLIVRQAQQRAQEGGGAVFAHVDPVKAVENADAVYTDVWTSMGFEQEETDRDRLFADYALNEELYARAAPGALIMHCMPMIRDKEISSALVEHEHSALFRQSENRLHAQKALLIALLGA